MAGFKLAAPPKLKGMTGAASRFLKMPKLSMPRVKAPTLRQTPRSVQKYL